MFPIFSKVSQRFGTAPDFSTRTKPTNRSGAREISVYRKLTPAPIKRWIFALSIESLLRKRNLGQHKWYEVL